MNIWLDISNSPHINMFRGLIQDLRKNHNVTITCRPLANTQQLLEKYKIEHTVIGGHYGRSITKKALGYPIQVSKLVKFLKHRKIDVSISQSSFHAPVAARLLGIDSIYLNDNEHAAGNILAFACATTIMVPEFMRPESLARQGANMSKVIRYPGVKEGIYLWNVAEDFLSPVTEVRRSARKVFIRPEPSTAQYYRGPTNFLDTVIEELQAHVEVTIIPRSKEQLAYYRQSHFRRCTILQDVMDIADVARECDLFIGAGGTMTREMGILGVPTISVYRDDLLDVDRHLIAQGAFAHMPSITTESVLEYLAERQESKACRPLLEKGRQAYELIKRRVENANANANQ